ncbi:MAG: P-II family nitrogen regulator [Candidatus Nitrosocaldus sp.]|nr:P-II family nitrogen regulator [Candidatus Nitrosocaldus sp.]MCS7141683.1 P-II family nitrogen regulator [Candidatus Nitrosocaldus sp.]MDW8000702.1 P-II family nitrogen regulator [Candidatus Nitrosocaldus sp.]MDW8276202.1 P-II family nitrogen regulator [Candidatus Nitrosocaldus sp.]
MKKIEAVVASEKVDIVYRALKRYGVDNVFIVNGYGKGLFQNILLTNARGTNSYRPELMPASKIELIVADREVEDVLDIIAKNAGIGINEGLVGRAVITQIEQVRRLEKTVKV